MAKTYFVDTNILLHNLGYLESKSFVVSSKTLIELEEIKTNRNKTEDVRQKARQAIRFIKDNETCEVFNWPIDSLNEIIDDYGVEHNADSYICAAAYVYAKSNEDSVFITNDISCLNIAKNIFRLNVEWPDEYSYKVDYTGFKEVVMDDDAMAYFYEHQDENVYDLLVNQYLIIRNIDNEVVDTLKWDGVTHVVVKFESMKSNYFGTIKPYKGDVYQRLLFNSFQTNKITMVHGPAGSGKTACAIYYLMALLEKHKIDRIIVFANTVPVVNSAKLGYYPGTRDEKLNAMSIGNILASKLGDSFAVEKLIAENKLMLIPMCDIRGFDTSGLNSGIILTEG